MERLTWDDIEQLADANWHRCDAQGTMLDKVRAQFHAYNLEYADLQRALDAERARVKELERERDVWRDKTKHLGKVSSDVQAQLRQVEGDAETYRKMHAVCTMNLALANNDLTTLRQLVEALPVVDGRMDVECGACYYIRSFIAGQYGVVCGLITEQSTAMAIKALLEYRATQAAQDAGAKLPAWVNEAMRLAPTQTNPPHPTEERYE